MEQKPIPVQERIVQIDILRGFAMLGIYLSIIHGFNNSIPYDGQVFSSYSQLDLFIDNLKMVLISNRFIGIFSLLFGIGIAIQEQRCQRKHDNFGPYFLKRMGILAFLGIINITFFFWGEILLAYSVFGILVLILSRLFSWKVLAAIAVAWFIAFHPVFEIYFKGPLINNFHFFLEEYPFDRVVSIYRSGSLLEMARVRWIEYGVLYTINSFGMGLSFALILGGYVVAKKGYHLWFIENLERTRNLFKIAVIYSVIFAVYAIVTGNVSFGFMTGMPFILYLMFLFCSLFSYIYLISSMRSNSRIARWLANNGRLALTGYVGVACFYAFIFHNNGLGLYLEYQALGQFWISFIAYILYTCFSTLWLSKFKYGPLEWVYRKLSYGRT